MFLKIVPQRWILDVMGGCPLASSSSRLSETYATCLKRRFLAWEIRVFPMIKKTPSVKFMDFLTWINVDWTNIQKKTTKGAYNNENSKFVVFNNWSSSRSSQNSDHSFPKLIFTPQSMRLKNLGVKCCFAHPILFLWKTQVLENTDFLWLIEADF